MNDDRLIHPIGFFIDRAGTTIKYTWNYPGQKIKNAAVRKPITVNSPGPLFGYLSGTLFRHDQACKIITDLSWGDWKGGCNG